MHKYLLKICSLLLISGCLLWEILPGAYISIENYQNFSYCPNALANTKQKSVLQEEGIYQIPFDALVSSFGSLFSELDISRNSKDNPTHDFLPTAHHADLSNDALYLIKSVKAFYHINSRSIYLLDCAFLI